MDAATSATPSLIAGDIGHATFGITRSVLRKLGERDGVTGFLRKLPR